jgi:hypothetical protein
MKKFEYQEITLGGCYGNNPAVDRASILSKLGSEGWRLICVVKHYYNSNGADTPAIELRGIIEREVKVAPILG